MSKTTKTFYRVVTPSTFAEKVTEISESIEDLGECFHCDEPITNKDSSYCSTGCNEQEEKELHAESGGC
tara:strand:+ start:256 stop:462 length:207 start_codon:yes stop_codon:yes gene_type:complete